MRYLLKEIEGMVKIYFSDLTKSWRLLVGLNKMAGYMRDVDEDEFYENVDDWLITRRKHELRGSEELFYSRFNVKLDAFWEKVDGPRNADILPMNELLMRPESWGTSGE
jgi:hypothetical protein